LSESGLAGFKDLLDDVFISRLSCSSLNLENHDSDLGCVLIAPDLTGF
jgi:hypothetical protein